MRDKPIKKTKLHPVLDSLSREYISPLEGSSEDYWDKQRKDLWCAVIGQAVSDCSKGKIREFNGTIIPNGGINCTHIEQKQAHHVLTTYPEYLAEFVKLDPKGLKNLAAKTYEESIHSVRQQRKEVLVP